VVLAEEINVNYKIRVSDMIFANIHSLQCMYSKHLEVFQIKVLMWTLTNIPNSFE